MNYEIMDSIHNNTKFTCAFKMNTHIESLIEIKAKCVGKIHWGNTTHLARNSHRTKSTSPHFLLLGETNSLDPLPIRLRY